MMKLLFSFKGRTGRAGFWVGSMIIMTAASVLGGVVGGVFGAVMAVQHNPSVDNPMVGMELAVMSLAIWAIVSLLSLYPSFALVVKRLHDLDRSGWTLVYVMFAVGGSAYINPLLPFLLIIIWNIYLGFFSGTDGQNNYGMPPSGLTGASAPEYDQVFA